MRTEHNLEKFYQEYDLDLAVIGGGVAGVVAAITAARLGLKTGIMQNRPVFGGPSSSECNSNEGHRLCVNGAGDYKNRNARETGIIEELKLEFQYRIAHGWSSHWSMILREFIKKEENVVSFLNTEAFEVETVDNRITSVSGRIIGAETNVCFKAPVFIDATGDSFVGYSAGADYRMGREARQEFDESLAPQEADTHTQGNTIMFKAIDTGKPIKFTPPDWAMKFESDEELPCRPHGNPSRGFWWLECGGTDDTIADNEDIYQKLLSVLFGVWDHIKNHGDHGADNYVIDWISPFAGKRESRRLIGDYILTQNDIVDNKRFDDCIAYGGWPIDIHPPEGVFGNSHPGSTPPFIFPGAYEIPYRCLYSRNVDNLMMIGRNISASHVALGSTRVMATCALMAQAAATAVVLGKKYGKFPREIGQGHIEELRQLLMRNDICLPEVLYHSVANFACDAEIKASSSMALALSDPNGVMQLVPEEKKTNDPCEVSPVNRSRAQMFPVSGNFIEHVELMFYNHNSQPVTIKAVLKQAADMYDFESTIKVSEAVIELEPGSNIKARFIFNADVIPGQLYFFELDQVAGVEVCTVDVPIPGIYMKADGCYVNDTNIWFEVYPRQDIFNAENVTNGYERAGNWPNLWISDPGLPMPQFLELDLNRSCKVKCIELVFDTNLNTMTVHGPVPECVKDYTISADGNVLLDVKGNHQRFRRHHLSDPVDVRKLKITVNATNGTEGARIYSVRVFGDDVSTEFQL